MNQECPILIPTLILFTPTPTLAIMAGLAYFLYQAKKKTKETIVERKIELMDEQSRKTAEVAPSAPSLSDIDQAPDSYGLKTFYQRLRNMILEHHGIKEGNLEELVASLCDSDQAYRVLLDFLNYIGLFQFDLTVMGGAIAWRAFCSLRKNLHLILKSPPPQRIKGIKNLPPRSVRSRPPSILKSHPLQGVISDTPQGGGQDSGEGRQKKRARFDV